MKKKHNKNILLFSEFNKNVDRNKEEIIKYIILNF